MSRSTTEITFEPIIIEQGDINYFNNQTTEILRRFIDNFKEELQYLETQSFYLKHKYFIINKTNLIDTLDWDEVRERQNKYIQEKQQYLQQIDLKKQKINLLKRIINQRIGVRFQQ